MARELYLLVFVFVVFLFARHNFNNTDSNSSVITQETVRSLNQSRLSSPSLQPPSSGLIDGIDRFEWYRKNAKYRMLRNAPNVSIMYAYEFDHEISISLSTWNFLGVRAFCRYLDAEGKEIGEPEDRFAHPEYTVHCPKRNGTTRIGLSVERNGEFEHVPIVDRTSRSDEGESGKERKKYELAMCVTPLFGEEPKWLWFIEMIEHYKLQGVQHFYVYIFEATLYDLKVVHDYERTGEIEVHYLLERDQREPFKWQLPHISDCLLRSREAKWTIFGDLDERILMTDRTILDYLRGVKDERIGGIQFRQQWVLKYELMPAKYQGAQQIETVMPTRRWHNTTGIASAGHAAKDIIDSSKVFLMWIHSVGTFFPGHGYYQYDLKGEEGVIRHYRDQSLGNWGHTTLPEMIKLFGPIHETDYPERFSAQLTANVKRRAQYVYGNSL